MHPSRRDLLAGCAALATAGLARPDPTPGSRVAITGGGWGGRSAARQLRALAPAMGIVLFRAQRPLLAVPAQQPLNRWLAGHVGGRFRVHGDQPAARVLGYRFLHARATAVDRERRTVATGTGPLPYDWPVLPVGICHNDATCFGADRDAAEQTRSRYPAAFSPRQRTGRTQGQARCVRGRRPAHEPAADALPLPAGALRPRS